MVVIGGCILVLVAVVIGFTMAGGHIGALIHLSEFITIGGASLGALIIMSPKHVLVDLVRGIIQSIKGTPYGRRSYVELFELMYALTRLVRRDGALALDSHISDPKASTLFAKYPRISGDRRAMDLLCTGLSSIVDGKTEPAQLQTAFEEEIQVIEREQHAVLSSVTKTADALPGFGIVAAVLGIVVTMQAIDGPASEVGHRVGAALVGTFLGILLSYGFLAPIAGRMEFLGEAELTYFRAIAAGVQAMSAGESPKDVIVHARRIVSTEFRPTQTELTQIFKDGGAG